MTLSSQPLGLAGACRLLHVGAMHKAILAITILGACGGGGTMETPDAAVTCALPMTEADAGSVTAVAAQECNVKGSMGAVHWWRLLGTLTSDPTDIVQLELWTNLGAFAGGDVHTGTFQIAGADADPKTCGVCVRAVGHHGDTSSQMQYFATAGTVVVDSFGAEPTQFTATITNAAFQEVDVNGALVPSGCASTLPHMAVSGPTVNKTGGGNGGGGGGTGTGTGTNGCATGVGDL